VKIRAFAGVVLLLLAGVLAWEFRWRAGHDLLKPPSPSPDGVFVAEVRSVPQAPASAPGTSGVFLRGRWAYLRAWKPQLVALGACDEVSARWFGERRLVIECELRAGEPRLLRDSVDGVVIELVVNRRFAWESAR
jgi:hypothetical protein